MSLKFNGLHKIPSDQIKKSLRTELGILLSRNDLVLSQESSSPEDESGSSFHTPHHTPFVNGGSSLSFITSQDSIDVFHDAYSTLNLQRRVPPLHQAPHNQPLINGRRRHASSGARFEDYRNKNSADEENEDEINERSCMLSKGPVARVRHSSYGKGSRSCNGSPFHSTKSPKRMSSPLPIAYIANYVPCVEVDMIKETDEKGPPTTHHLYDPVFATKPEETLKHPDGKHPKISTTQTPTNGCKNSWLSNYVPCAELETLLYRGCVKGDSKDGRERRISAFDMVPGQMENRKPGWRRRVKEEFAKSNFKLEHESPHLFVISQWQKPNDMSCLYLGYRLFWAAYFCMWCIWSIVEYKGVDAPFNIKMYYWLNLTTWGLWMLSIDCSLQATNCILHMRKISSEGEARYSRMLTRLKVSWIFSNITTTTHIIITVFYWIFLFPIAEHPFSVVSVNTHIVQCVYVVIDLWISATPRRLLHAYMPMMYLLVYGIFSAFYFLGGGKNLKGNVALYPILNWTRPSKTLLFSFFLLCLFVPLIHLFGCLTYWIRLKLWRTRKLRFRGDKGNYCHRAHEERV